MFHVERQPARDVQQSDFGYSGKCEKLGGNVFHVKRFAWWPVT